MRRHSPVHTCVETYLRRFKMGKAEIAPIAVELGGRIVKESTKLPDRWIASTLDTELAIDLSRP